MAVNLSDDSTQQIENQLKGLLKISGSTSLNSLQLSAADDAVINNGQSTPVNQPRITSENIDLNKVLLTPEALNGTSSGYGNILAPESPKEIPISSSNDPNSQTINLSEDDQTNCYSLYKENINIITNSAANVKSKVPGSDQVKIQHITKFDWSHKYYNGNLLTISKNYIAYAIKTAKGFPIRVLNQHNSSDRILLRGFTSELCDVAFANFESPLIAGVDQDGNFILWHLSQQQKATIHEKRLHIKGEDQPASPFHRLVWMPSMRCEQDIAAVAKTAGVKLEEETSMNSTLALTHGDNAEVWDVNKAISLYKSHGKDVASKQHFTSAYVTVQEHTDVITDCELSPDGSVLATASHDGFVKFWQILFEENAAPPLCLHKFEPHDGRPVSAIVFFDDHVKTQLDVYWRFLFTGCNHNTEMKVWCTVTWNCLQQINVFAPPGPDSYQPQLKYGLHASANYLALSDVMGKVLYIFRVTTDPEAGTASLDTMAQYLLTMPLLSMAVVGAREYKFKIHGNNVLRSGDDNNDMFQEEEGAAEQQERINGVLVKIYSIHTKSLEMLDVRFIPPSFDLDQPTSSSINTYNTSSDEVNYSATLDSSIMSQANDSGDEFELTEDETVQENTTLEPAKHETTNDPEPSNHADVEPEKEDSDLSLSKTMEASLTQSVMDLIGDVNQKAKMHEGNSLPPLEVENTNLKTKETADGHQKMKLLLPSAFAQSINTGASVDSSFTHVTPYNHETIVNDDDNDEVKPTFEQDSESPCKTPNASPTQSPVEIVLNNLPTLSSNEVPLLVGASPNKSDYSKPDLETVEVKAPTTSKLNMSPDLISSAATSDVGKQAEALEITEAKTDVTESPLSGGGGAGDAPYMMPSNNNDHVKKSTTSTKPESLHSSPHGASASPTTWPKAPDVTMFHRTSHRVSPSSSREDLVNSENEALNKSSNAVPKKTQSVTQVQMNEIMSALRSMQSKQEEMFRAQQREMNKKHNQLVKNIENTLKRIETHQDEKIERALRAERRTLPAAGSRSDADIIAKKFEATMKNTVIPNLSSLLVPLRDQLHDTLANKLTATNTVLKDSIGKMLRSKETLEMLGNTTGRIVQAQVTASYRDIFVHTVLPAFDNSCQNIMQQMTTTFQAGIDETIGQVNMQIQGKVKSEVERLEKCVQEAKVVVQELKEANTEAAKSNDMASAMRTEMQNMQKQLTAEVEKTARELHMTALQEQRAMLEGCVISINEKLSSVVQKQPSTPSKREKTQQDRKLTFEEQQRKILSLLQQGHVNSAFQRALSAGDLNLVMYVCEMVDPAKVLGATECALQQPILLSLIQQLSCDLETNTELKLRYLKEAVMNLDTEHQVIKDHIKPILETLVTNLASQSSRPSTPTGSKPNTRLIKDMKMLSMAAQSLI